MGRRLTCNPDDLLGRKFAHLLVVECSKVNNRTQVKCRCDCGREILLRPIDLLRKNVSQCGYCRNFYLIGRRFGRLTVIDRAGYDKTGKRFMWLCKCDCGKTKKVETSHLLRGSTRSCGCLAIDVSHTTRTCLPPGVANFHKVRDSYRRNAKLRGLEFALTDDEMLSLFAADCFYCGRAPSTTLKVKNTNQGFTYNGIDRLDNAIGYVRGNVVSCCPECNYKKGDQHVDDFLKWVRSVAVHLELSQKLGKPVDLITFTGHTYA